MRECRHTPHTTPHTHTFYYLLPDWGAGLESIDAVAHSLLGLAAMWRGDRYGNARLSNRNQPPVPTTNESQILQILKSIRAFPHYLSTFTVPLYFLI